MARYLEHENSSVNSHHSAKDGSLAASTVTGSNFSALPFSFGIISPYPPSFLLYKMLISPGPKIQTISYDINSKESQQSKIIIIIKSTHQFLHSENHRNHGQYFWVVQLLLQLSKVAYRSILSEQSEIKIKMSNEIPK